MKTFLEKITVNVGGKFTKLKKKKDNGGSEAIVVIGLMIVAVIVVIAFKDKIVPVIEGAIGSMETKLNGLFT